MAQQSSTGSTSPHLLNTGWGKQAAQYLGSLGYQFTKEIGEGSFGSVYEVWSIPMKRKLACKAMKMSPSALDLSPDKCIAEMTKESDILKELDHPNIIKMFEVIHRTYPGDIYCFIFMELCDTDLLNYYWNTPSRHLSPEQAHEWFVQIVSGLKYLHEKHISHLDIKPGNILVKKEPNGQNVFKLTDFGLSKMFKPNEPNIGKDMSGTPIYQPPEVDSFKNLFLSFSFTNFLNFETKPSDIYSLGVTLFESVTGKTMFKIQILKDIYSTITNPYRGMHENMIHLIEDMTNGDPKLRPTIQDIANNVWVQSGAVRRQTGTVQTQPMSSSAFPDTLY